MNRITVNTMQFFPYAVGLLDLGATIVYMKQHEYRLAITWFCYAIAAAALGGVK